MRRALLALLAGAVLLVGTAGPAGAHVSVSTTSAAPGSTATLSFSVPTESETASTTRFTVQLPTAPAFTSVRTQAIPGWTATVSSTTVEWTAQDGGIRPGEFQTFALSVAPLPSPGTLYLPAVQHYSNGTDVGWVQQAQGGAQPGHPAPSIAITPTSGTSTTTAVTTTGHGGHGGTAAVTLTGGTSGSAPAGPGIGLSLAAIILALAAGAISAAALRRTVRRQASSRADP